MRQVDASGHAGNSRCVLGSSPWPVRSPVVSSPAILIHSFISV